MTSFGLAIEQRRWQLVSLYLLLGISDAAALLPRETLAELLDLLGPAPSTAPPGGRPEERRGR